MKVIFALLSMIAFSVSAQDAGDQKYKEPDFVGDIKYVGSGKDVLLEKEMAVIGSKGGMYSKIKTTSSIKGLQSSLKIHPIDKLVFLVKVADNSVNPTSIVNVFKLDQDKKTNSRFVTVMTTGTFSGQKAAIDFKAFEYSKYGNNCYLIVFPKSLETGEYAITLEGSRQIFNVFTITTEP